MFCIVHSLKTSLFSVGQWLTNIRTSTWAGHIFLLPVWLIYCPYFCPQKWNLLCYRECQATGIWSQLCWHEETVLYDWSRGGRETEIQLPIFRRLQQDRQTDQLDQGEGQNTLCTDCWSAKRVQWKLMFKTHTYTYSVYSMTDVSTKLSIS